MADKGFTFENLVPPDEAKIKKIRPFKKGEFFDNQDGTKSTERTMSFNVDGKEVLAPSLWMTVDGPVDLSRSPESIMRALKAYEESTGNKFPRFDTPEEATEFAKNRSNRGGRGTGSLTK